MICMIITAGFSLILGMALVLIGLTVFWVIITIALNLIVIIFSSALIYHIGSDKNWWDSKDELDAQRNKYYDFCKTYEAALRDFQKIQIDYYYKKQIKADGRD